MFALCESERGKMLIDSSKVVNGYFFISLYLKQYTGFIYLQGDNDFVTNPLMLYVSGKQNDTIEVKSTGINYNDSLCFKNSTSNELFYQLLKIFNLYAFKLYFVKELLKNYPLMDDVYLANKQLYDNLLKQFKKEHNLFQTKIKKVEWLQTLANYALVQKELFLDTYLDKPNYLLIKRCLFRVNEDTALLNTDILEHVFRKFTMSVYNDSLPQMQMEKIMQDSFYSLINTYPFKRLLLKKFGGMYLDFLSQHDYYESITDYLPIFVNKQTSNPNFKPKLAVGEKIKTIRGLSQQGYFIDINDFKSDYKLILIWSPECEHCVKTVSELDKLYEQVKKNIVEFYSFSVLKYDSNYKNVFAWKKSAYLPNSRENTFLKTYSINYTPVILLLNKENVIIDIPPDAQRLSMILGKLGLLVN